MPESFVSYAAWLNAPHSPGEKRLDAEDRECCYMAALLVKMGFAREELFVLIDGKRPPHVVPGKVVHMPS